MIDFPTQQIRLHPFNIDYGAVLEPTFCLIFKKTIDLVRGAVKGADCEAMIGNVQDQVLAHDGQANEAEISTMVDPRRSADIDAGKTGATVSPLILSELSAASCERDEAENDMHGLIEIHKHHAKK